MPKKNGFFNIIIFFIIPLIAMVPVPAESDSTVDFKKLNGSDLGMGIGARAIGLGGAFVAIADDASAVFWNPAGLTHMETSQLLFSADLPDEFSAACVVYKPSFWNLDKIHLTTGFSHINRLRFNGDSGENTWEGNPSHILGLAMIDVEKDFQGSVNSKTIDNRISLAFRFSENSKWSAGLNYIFID